MMTITDASVRSDVVQEWDELAGRTGASPFLRPAWVLARHRAFTPDAPLDLVEVRRDGALAGVLPLCRLRGSLVAFDGYDTEAGPVVVDADAAAEVAERVVASGRPVAMRSVPAESGWADALAVAARRARAPLSVRVRRSSLHVDVAGGWDDYERSLGRSRRQQARRRWRRLSEAGALTFEARDGTEDLDALLDEGFRVEASGWKGAGGTAITSSHEQRRFHEDLAAMAAVEGTLRLYFLRLDGRPLAFSFDLRGGAVQYHLKGGFDESFAEYSPGILIRMRIIEQICGDPHIELYDLLGQEDHWKQQLATGGRDRLQVWLHPPGLVGHTRHRARLAAVQARVEAERRLPESAWQQLHRTSKRVRRPA